MDNSTNAAIFMPSKTLVNEVETLLRDHAAWLFAAAFETY
jgi:hypothetical protein